MQLVEKHIITSNSPFYKECDDMSFLTKNLYNSCLYQIRQAYIKDKTNLLYNLHHIMKDTEQYKAVPAKVASTVLLMVQKNFKSFFKSNADFYKNPSKYKGKPRLPKYLDPNNGRFVVSYTNQAISKKIFKKLNKIKLSQTNIEFYSKITDFNLINCVRIIPNLGYFTIEVVYTIPDTIKLEDNNRYISLDLGVNNLATITSNINDIKPIIINGKPLKSINQYYNKERARITSILEKRNKKKTSKKLNKITFKRKNKIGNYLHKSSKEIVNLCIKNNINTVIIGKNDNWKQDINIGSKNNQNFVNIPHSRFIEMISYKCEMSGINIILQEESYTSKASFLNLDKIPIFSKTKSNKHEFSGYREHRGMYKLRGDYRRINADVNGSYNILRKAIPNAFSNGIEGIGVYPIVITMK
jgi:putative transposase